MGNLSVGWRKWLWLVAGVGLGLVGSNNAWSVAAVGWVFSICLLRFTRSSGVVAGFLWVVAGSAVATVVDVVAAGQGGTAAILVGCVVLSALLSLPLLADRLLVGQLGPVAGTLVLPLVRVAAEFLIASVSPLGTIFGVLGTSQSAALPLLQLVSVTGIYGISFLMAWTAPVVNVLLERRAGLRAVAVYGGVLGLVLVGGGVRLALAPTQQPVVRVAGVSVSQAAEATKRRLGSNAAGYDALNQDLFAQTRREAAAGARIVAWPEAAAAILQPDYPGFLSHLEEVARDNRIYLDAGVAIIRDGGSRDIALLVGPDGRVLSTYDKAHPVPGLEDLTPGDGRVPVTPTPYGDLANVICFDSDFPRTLRTRADIMFVPSNDWPEIERTHARNAVFRAVENGYALVRQASGGIAISTDAYGVPLARSEYFSAPQQSMVVAVPTHGTRTVYGVVGDLFAWLCVAGAAALIALTVVRRKGALR